MEAWRRWLWNWRNRIQSCVSGGGKCHMMSSGNAEAAGRGLLEKVGMKLERWRNVMKSTGVLGGMESPGNKSLVHWKWLDQATEFELQARSLGLPQGCCLVR